MSKVQAIDLSRLEELRRRFDQAAFDHPNVDGVVIYRPDLRHQDTERKAHRIHFTAADLTSENYNAELTKQTKSEYAAIRCAVNVDAWIPPGSDSIEELGGQHFWARILKPSECTEYSVPPFDGDLWRCILFGLKVPDVANTALRVFDMLAEDAAQLILTPSEAKGTALLSRWLIYLADRAEPLSPDAGRIYLSWPEPGSVFRTPMWVPVTPSNPPTCWWAVRLRNVFQLSRLAIEPISQLHSGKSQSVILTDEDKTILFVLSEANSALTYLRIVTDTAYLLRKRNLFAREKGFVPLSETKLVERVPVLESQGLIERPVGPNGKRTTRKGIGINDLGRTLLKSTISPAS